MAMCYCPQYDGCDDVADFVQQIGVLHFFASRACPNGVDADECKTHFKTVTPLQRFALRVDCPTDACSLKGASRIKLAAGNIQNDVPSWNDANGCSHAQHGYNKDGHHVLPFTFNPDVTTMHGGHRQDYKLWNYRNLTDCRGNLFKFAATSGFAFMSSDVPVGTEVFVCWGAQHNVFSRPRQASGWYLGKAWMVCRGRLDCISGTSGWYLGGVCMVS